MNSLNIKELKHIKHISNTLKLNDYVIIKDYLTSEIPNILIELDIISSRYSEQSVKDKIFRQREDHPSRKGDACMVTLQDSDLMPYNNISEFKSLRKLFELYTSVIKETLNEPSENIKNIKLLMNSQEYNPNVSSDPNSDNSLPFHMDVELIKGNWGKEQIDIKEGIIPRYVMVYVTENQNNKKGLKIKSHSEIDIPLDKGDLIIFDNTKILHGVPSLPFPRKIVGFRSFETQPFYFKESSKPQNFQNHNYKGNITKLTTKQAIEKLVTKGWYY